MGMKTQQGGQVPSQEKKEKNYNPYIEEQTRSGNKNTIRRGVGSTNTEHVHNYLEFIFCTDGVSCRSFLTKQTFHLLDFEKSFGVACKHQILFSARDTEERRRKRFQHQIHYIVLWIQMKLFKVRRSN
ncbi:hypothetical protein TNCV_75631 [Trichonephila clavipes]|nr:hypothetical protein TNCV_75631 [Trichonephila clavipes]